MAIYRPKALHQDKRSTQLVDTTAPKSFAITAVYLLLSLASATPVTLEARDLLNSIGPTATAEQEKWCPALAYDTYSCYNTVAISPTGQLKFVSASEHGKWNIRLPGQNLNIRFEGSTHAKIVYHKDGAGTHAFRYANGGDEPPENHWQSWRWRVGAGLLKWDSIAGNLRTTLSQKDWSKAEVAVRDKGGKAWNFGWYLDRSRYYCVTELECPGNLATVFDPWA
ncbi:hypothetical protein QC764_115230 [Podospora pseudoanserina]|uniref:Uncharacterized protein n=1 Tax=Podospora pseudoanserina TaxID=2609844 RepID=A0ABR0IPL0_9PEZI|nr:hypothetical protein QC764_115230 [Podospora pseudoanserina]